MLDLERTGRSLHTPLLTFAASAIALLLIGGGWGIFLAYFDTAVPFTSTYVITADANGNPSSVFRAGELMRVRRDLCFTRDAPVTMGRTLNRIAPGREQLNIAINTTAGMLRRGCVPNANLVRIPDYTPPGRYEYRVIVQFSNNFMHAGSELLPVPIIEVVP